MSNKRIGYGRISTSDQKVASQEDALKAAKVDKLFIDTFTGTKAARPQLDKMKEQLRSGDTLVITRLDRLGRSTKDLLNLVSELEDLGVNLEVIEQRINTSTPDGKLFFTMIAAFAEFEREIMRARTMDGLAAARARGKIGGRKPKMTPAKVKTAVSMYEKGLAITEISDAIGVSRPTIYRMLDKQQEVISA